MCLVTIDMPDIKGLTYIPNFISAAHHDKIIKWADSHPWDNTLKRRTQQYGWKYDYRAKTVTRDAYLGDLPTVLLRIAARLHDNGLIEKIPDQCIVNEYMPGQGIGKHVDCEPCFGDRVFSLSLGSSAQMDFHSVIGKRTESILLEPCSLLMMYGVARYDWKHGIPARHSDPQYRVHRARRISLTFRTVVVA